MPIANLQQAIAAQAEVNRFLVGNHIRDLVGDYGELLVWKVFGGRRENSINCGFDIQHPQLHRIEVKTRKYELRPDGSIRKENRAVGFNGKENGFDWLAHVILQVDFSVVAACVVSYRDVWPEIERTTEKVSFSTTSCLPSSRDVTEQVRNAQRKLGF